MKFITITFLLFISLTNAVTLILWSDPDACSGSGTVCQNIPEETCCEDGKLYGSGEARDAPQGRTSVAQLFSRRNNKQCDVNLGPVKPIPVCIVSGLDQSVGGMAWEFQGSSKKRDEQLAIPTSSVIGDPAYSDGETIWVISKEKMARENLKQPENKAELAAFFKAHADSIIPADKSIPSVQVNTTESK
ncbi:hypothetical protein DV736_g6626, partial [Chaetothyriales sp. CBS 134916]